MTILLEKPNWLTFSRGQSVRLSERVKETIPELHVVLESGQSDHWIHFALNF